MQENKLGFGFVVRDFQDRMIVTKIGMLHGPIKDKNIGFDGYIGTWILRIYRRYQRYISGYFYMNINISKIKLL